MAARRQFAGDPGRRPTARPVERTRFMSARRCFASDRWPTRSAVGRMNRFMAARRRFVVSSSARCVAEAVAVGEFVEAGLQCRVDRGPLGSERVCQLLGP